MKNKGFMLVEAILASTILATVYLSKVMMDEKVRHGEHLDAVASDISSIMSAIDKRVVVDGSRLEDGWSQEWVSTSSVLSGAITSELVASGNTDCGINSGWSPKLATNNDVALVDCSLIGDSKTYHNFKLTSKRFGLADDDTELSEWSFYLEPDVGIKNWVVDASRLVEKLNAKGAFSMTGSNNYNLIDKVSESLITPVRCLELGSDCLLKATYNSNSSAVYEDSYLRVNGENLMRNSLVFRTGADIASCYRYSSPSDIGSRVDTECGMDLDMLGGDDFLHLGFDQVTSTALNLIYQSKGEASTPVTCKAPSETGSQAESVICGYAFVEGADTSIKARAHINSFIADSALTVVNGSGDAVVEVDSDGEMNISGSFTVPNLTVENLFDVGGELIVSNSITTAGLDVSNGELMVGDMVLSGSVTGSGDANTLDAIFGDLTVGADVTVGENSILTRLDADSISAEDVSMSNLSVTELAKLGSLRVSSGAVVGDDCTTTGNIGKDSQGLSYDCFNSSWELIGAMKKVDIPTGQTVNVMNIPEEYKVGSLNGEIYDISSPEKITLPHLGSAWINHGSSCGGQSSYERYCNGWVGGNQASGCSETFHYREYRQGSLQCFYSDRVAYINGPLPPVLTVYK